MCKVAVLFILSLAVSFNVFSATIYLVRHAEKAQGDDPSLTEKGQQRAKQLAYLLEHANITQIYSTHYKRAMQTAKPLAEKIQVSIEHYDPKQLDEFSEKLKSAKTNVLIVGHSNSTPQLVKLLSDEVIKPMSEDDYGDVYQISFFSGQQTFQHFQIPPANEPDVSSPKAVKNGVNFVKVSDRIDTSGQPSKELLQRFAEKKYQLVINLAPPRAHGSVLEEGGLVAQTGARYVNIPVEWGEPTYQDFELFSHVLNGPGAEKVLVHCQINMRGSLFTFLYRVIHEKIDPEIALEKLEMVWAPSGHWQKFAQDTLNKHNIDFTLF
ncbi:MAG: histidine phosphatase family protein [Proteobacteria bacterium]|nr:histidine phosphatase family protein [Pseudomonadota bacterium]